MNKKAFVLGVVALFALTSCEKDNQKDNSSAKWNGGVSEFNKKSEYNFENSAVNQIRPFIDNLLILNDKIDKTTLYSEEEFNQLYKKKISLPMGGVSIEDYTASSPDLFAKNNDLKNKAKDRFSQSVKNLIQLRKTILKGDTQASQGKAGFVGTDEQGGVKRYVNEKGIELAEATEKQIMGIILLDQIINNHLGDSVMKNQKLREENSGRKFLSRRNYTELEYHWDVAYTLLGRENRDNKPKFIANYIINEYQGADFIQNIDVRVFRAFSEGRLALSRSDYATVEKNIEIIRDAISKLFAARVIYYLNKAAPNLSSPNSLEYGEGIHNLSEVYGFIPALVATRKASGEFYFNSYDTIAQLLKDLEGTNGFWEKERLTSDENTTGSLKNIAKRVGDIYGIDYKKVK